MLMNPTSITATRSYRLSTHTAGFSLVELMVAMTLGLILMGGVVSIVANTSRSHAELDKNSRQIENGRYAIQTLRDDIRHAGYYGEFHELTTPAIAPDPCDTAVADLQAGMALPVQGYEGDGDDPTGCLTGYVANTDVLVIRRASTVTTAAAALTAAETYLQTRSDAMVLETGVDETLFNLTQKDGATLADIRKYIVHIYFIRNCSDCSGGGDGIPTLTRAEFIDGDFDNLFPIAEGIENLQLRYGIDDTGNGTPDRLETLPASVTDWSNVMTVEANILARNTEETQGHTDAKSYTLGDVAIGAPGDGFKRHVFTAMVRAENPSSRREE